MKLKLLFLTTIIPVMGFSQVGINTPVPRSTLDISAKRDSAGNISDTSQHLGIQAPRITRAELTASTATYDINQNGSLIYITDISSGNATAGTQREFITAIGYYYFDAVANRWLKLLNSEVDPLKAIAYFSSDVAGYQMTSIQYPTYTKILYTGETSDNGNSFNPATGVYTIPSDGTYFFSASVQFDNTSPGLPNYTTMGLRLVRQTPTNTALVTQQFTEIITKLYSMSITGAVQCKAGDQIYTMFVGITQTAGSNYQIAAASLLGWKIAN
ncbi:hypothetical protein DBR28_12640 [Chryseobacterium sp. HMWF028]|jgi:hypothetical protein|nr:hypothetical protein DBR28_12640 [Chryseobacterium sp. HMWF028]